MTHVVTSVGWLGAVAAFLALAVAAVGTNDAATQRALYIAMEVVGSAARVPLSLASFVSGLVQSMGTPWGAVPAVVGDRQARHLRDRHRVLLLYTSTWRALGDAAASPTLADDQALLPSASPGLHSGAALVVLLIAAALSVYKPKGLTRYGWRKQQRRSTQPALALMRPGS